jgi:hypothetical protein
VADADRAAAGVRAERVTYVSRSRSRRRDRAAAQPVAVPHGCRIGGTTARSRSGPRCARALRPTAGASFAVGRGLRRLRLPVDGGGVVRGWSGTDAPAPAGGHKGTSSTAGRDPTRPHPRTASRGRVGGCPPAAVDASTDSESASDPIAPFRGRTPPARPRPTTRRQALRATPTPPAQAAAGTPTSPAEAAAGTRTPPPGWSRTPHPPPMPNLSD